MKKAIAVVLSLVFVFALTSLSLAAEKKAAPAEKKEASHAMKESVTGDVTAVDAKAKMLTVKGKTGDVSVSVDDKTKITAGKEAKTLADLKTGDKVTVKYIVTDGKNTAKKIEINAAPKK
ncbi:MAG: hypothetical protein HZA14_08525 [Nitrospirae bacterium]|nr:hypothetical protein [Nitrospirota bacterium]